MVCFILKRGRLSNKDFVLSFGEHKGKRLDDVPLLYLDWLVGEDWLHEETKRIVSEYLSEPVIKKELEKELENKEG